VGLLGPGEWPQPVSQDALNDRLRAEGMVPQNSHRNLRAGYRDLSPQTFDELSKLCLYALGDNRKSTGLNSRKG
jgi:hypothetical protein